jgi:F0F1-type ATP synthase assembly protein I
MLICIIFLILLQFHNNKILGYSIFILGFIYILPVIVFCLILVITKLTNFLEDINKKSLYKTIKIKSIHANLQHTINNV